MPSPKPRLVIAGPGAGKTHNMVETIIGALPYLSPAKYMVVITYTNSATNNIRKRLSKKIKIPENLFIGTIHAFMNRFIVIPFGSFSEEEVGKEKRFIQCSLKAVFERHIKDSGKTYSQKESGIVKANIKNSLNKQGYISFDQTLNIAAQSMAVKEIAELVADRLQYLFIDEFQDTNNKVYEVLEILRKQKKTEIYIVGDPEQYITSFDSSIKNYTRIPILRAAGTNVYDLSINQTNRRCSKKITTFLNNFNKRQYGSDFFEQLPYSDDEGHDIKFIDEHTDTKPIVERFIAICENLEIQENDRCIIAKKNDVIRRIESVLEGRSVSPNQNGAITPLNAIKDTILASAQLTQSEFCKKNDCSNMKLRQYCVETMIALSDGRITNEASFFEFITENFGITVKTEIPININGLKYRVENTDSKEFTLVGNIHQVKGLEAKAVLTIAKTEEELKLWLTIDQTIRETKRGKEDTDYPRIGYVAFSRAEELLCIGCLEQISEFTRNILTSLNVYIVGGELNAQTKIESLF
ncbi:UvrD-helicase domain-containing protein [Reichenbachiella versicolor]|uniref:UvrD-helicase domain-containing protein n=1 Tax=Reichenbachiella versicolor TaxID=1821036 RepID=UPI0013A5B291|nr:UvrD-helicase domain-containing protein [Reichenbachiella versicolor]